MRFKTIAALALMLFAQPVAADPSALTRCNSLFGSSFDCLCATKFLEARIASADLDVLLPLWAYSLEGSDKHSAEFARFDERHGVTKINRILHQFHSVRLELFMQCPACSPDREAGE